MKILLALLALTVSVSTFASTQCEFTFTGNYRTEVTSSVPLSEFGINSWMTQKKVVSVLPEYVRTCREVYPTVAGNAIVQSFPSVALSEFNVNSWKVAK